MSDVRPQATLSRMGPMGLLVGVVGLALFAVGYFGAGTVEAKRAVMESYVYGYIFWTCLTLGCLGLTLLHHTIRARWGLAVLRIVEAGGGPAALIAMAVMFIPIALNVMSHSDASVYLWARPGAEHDHLLHNKAFYLNVPFFLGRQVLYFGVWALLAGVLRRSSLRQDQTLDPAESVKRTNLSAPGIVLYCVMLTFAVTDWVMSLEPHWFSTLLPLLFVAGQALTALAMAVVLITVNREAEPFKRVLNSSVTKDLGNMIFALTLLWTYMTVSQYIITYSGNLPEETPYYLRRAGETGWSVLGMMVIVGQFFIPFLALLAPRTKAVAKNLLAVACLVLAVRFLDLYWTVMPGLRTSLTGSLAHWTDYAAVLGIGGVWFAVWGSQIKKAALLPVHDTRLEDSPAHA